MKIKKEIGNRIRAIRGQCKQTLQQFAQALDVSKSSLSGYELGDIYPSIEVLIKVAEMGNTSVDWIVRGSKEATCNEPENGLTPEEIRLLQAFRSMPKVNQVALLRLAEAAVK